MHGIVERKLCTFTFIDTIIWNQSNLIVIIQNNCWKYVCVCVCVCVYISQINNIHLKATMICKVALTRHFWQSTGVWHMADTNTSKTRQTPVPSGVFFYFYFFLSLLWHGVNMVFAGSVDSEVFFFFWVLTGSAIDEASTSDIEIAPLFALTIHFSLTRLLSLCFFHLLFLQFSFLLWTPESSGLFEDDWQLAFCQPLNTFYQPLIFKFHWV